MKENEDKKDKETDWNRVDVLIVGAGPAGLAAAISLKTTAPELVVCVIDKSAATGNHCLSGAVVESGCLASLLDPVAPDWRESKEAKTAIVGRVKEDDILFLSKEKTLPLGLMIKGAGILGLGYGRMNHKGDYICSLSRLAGWLGKQAEALGVELINGFAAAKLEWDEQKQQAVGLRLVDQGLNRSGEQQQNYRAGELIKADYILLAEGCDGLISERFIKDAGLVRNSPPLFSLGVKELIRVSDSQYERFGASRVVHAMGYPLWQPFTGIDMFGGGIMYPVQDNRIAVGIIVGLDFVYHDFNPQDALAMFKKHPAVAKYIAGGSSSECGAKMIPEGGFHSIPRDPANQAIGKGNVLILGDSAGLVDMHRIKGVHNAIYSGIAAAKAVAAAARSGMGGESGGTMAKASASQTGNTQSGKLATEYTAELSRLGVLEEMDKARNFRQLVARFGSLVGMGLATGGRLLAKPRSSLDYKHTKKLGFPQKPERPFNKDAFIALSGTEHREEEPCHLIIKDSKLCLEQCKAEYHSPCVSFCPAGVYEEVAGTAKPANPSNCLHCKTCQRKCPFDNIRWTVPEGGGGPRYHNM